MLLSALLVGGQLVLPQTPCFSNTFRGIFRDGDDFKALYIPTQTDCIFESTHHVDSGHIFDVESDTQLVWLQHSAVDPVLLDNSSPGLDAALGAIHAMYTNPSSQPFPGDQLPLQDYFAPHIHYQSPQAVLLSMDPMHARDVDLHLPPFWTMSLVSDEGSSYIPVPDKDILRIEKILGGLHFNPEVAAIVNNLSVTQMSEDISILTGENSRSTIVSRHAFSEGALMAVAWLKDRFEEAGAACALHHFLEGFSPNLVCKYKGISNSNTTAILGAHYDSRGSFGSTRAPGGDDDGSGITALLAIARTISRRNIKFQHDVELVAFSGEEQGLLGSKSYAQHLRKTKKDVLLMIQADMLAYHSEEEPMQLGLPEVIGTSMVTYLVGNVSNIYSPELTLGYTPACCSDHQSFHEQGFAATQVFERAGPIIDPMYHNSGDLSRRKGFDFAQLKAIAKVQFATLLHSAGFES